MEPLTACQGRAHVLGRTTLRSADFAAGYIAEALGLPDGSAASVQKARQILLHVLGLASWEGVDPTAALRIYHTSSQRYAGRPDFVVVKKQGVDLPGVRATHSLLDLGSHVATDLASMPYRLVELEAYLREDVRQEPQVAPFHLQWYGPDEEELPETFLWFLQASELTDRDLVATGRYHEYRCLAEPGSSEADRDELQRAAEELLQQGWYQAERGETVRCFGRGRVLDYESCDGYHENNLLARLTVDNPDRDAQMDTQLIMKALAPKEGMRVVDVGAGMGYFTFKLAKIVGESGRIYATELHPCAIRYLKTGMLARGTTNVELSHVAGGVVSYPYEQIDAVLFANTSAFEADISLRISDLDAYRRIHDALRPGGKVIIWEPSPRSVSAQGEVRMTEPQDSIEAFEQMGFRVAENMPEVPLDRTAPGGRPIFLVFEKVVSAPADHD